MKKLILLFIILILALSSCTKIIDDKTDENETQTEINDNIKIFDNSMELVPTREPIIKNDKYYENLLEEFNKNNQFIEYEDLVKKLYQMTLSAIIPLEIFEQQHIDEISDLEMLSVVLKYLGDLINDDEDFIEIRNNKMQIFIKEEITDKYLYALFNRKIDYSKAKHDSYGYLYNLYYSPKQCGTWYEFDTDNIISNIKLENFSEKGNNLFEIEIGFYNENELDYTKIFTYKAEENRIYYVSVEYGYLSIGYYNKKILKPPGNSGYSDEISPTRKKLVKDDIYYEKLLDEYNKKNLFKKYIDLEEKLYQMSLNAIAPFRMFKNIDINEISDTEMLNISLSYLHMDINDEEKLNGISSEIGQNFLREETIDKYLYALFNRKIDYNNLEDTYKVVYSPEQSGVWLNFVKPGFWGTPKLEDFTEKEDNLYEVKIGFYNDDKLYSADVYTYKAEKNRIYYVSVKNVYNHVSELIPFREPITKDEKYYADLVKEYIKTGRIPKFETIEEQLFSFTMSNNIAFTWKNFNSINEFTDESFLPKVLFYLSNDYPDLEESIIRNNKSQFFIKEELIDMYAFSLFERKIDYTKFINHPDLLYSPEQCGMWVNFGFGGDGGPYDYEVIDKGNNFYDLNYYCLNEKGEIDTTIVHKFKWQDGRFVSLAIVTLENND